jgi:hypothetical protein
MFTASAINRFFSRVIIPNDFGRSCWLWTGKIDVWGYGSIGYRNYTCNAHRFSYELYHGEIPPKHFIHHLCENKHCVNPMHLEMMLHGEHTRLHATKPICKNGHIIAKYGRNKSGKCNGCMEVKEMLRSEKRKYCKNGHLNIPENRNGYRCAICAREYYKQYYRNKRR